PLLTYRPDTCVLVTLRLQQRRPEQLLVLSWSSAPRPSIQSIPAAFCACRQRSLLSLQAPGKSPVCRLPTFPTACGGRTSPSCPAWPLLRPSACFLGSLNSRSVL